MSDKNHDKIRRDRIKSQHDLIELKKMQQGQLPIPQKPSEVVAESFKEKNENFWFYNKYKVLAIIIVAAILAITIRQCINKEKYDCTVVLSMKQYVSETAISAMEQQLELYCDDYDGNGEVNVMIIDCAYDADSYDQQLIMAKSTKYQVQFTSPESVLFIIDQASFNSFDELMEGGLMDDSIGLPDCDGKALDLKGTALDQAVLEATGGNFISEDYYIVKRKIEGSAISNKKSVKEYNQQATEIITKMSQAYK